MITIQLRAGLGNQMFQYAFGKALTLEHNTELFLDCTYLEDHGIYKKILKQTPRNFDLGALKINNYKIGKKTIHNKLLWPLGEMPLIGKIYDNFYERMIHQKIFREKTFFYDEKLHQKIDNNAYIIGYWQCYKYFDKYKDTIQEEFKPQKSLDKDSIALLDNIQKSESVCINVRRGDYLTDPLFYVQDKTYYDRGIEYIQNKVNNKLSIFVFSDDLERCKQNFTYNNLVFVEKSFAGPQYTHYQELMSHCKHFVGANSSFCRWAIRKQWNKNKIIILPKLWFHHEEMNTKDLIPQYRNTLLL